MDTIILGKAIVLALITCGGIALLCLLFTSILMKIEGKHRKKNKKSSKTNFERSADIFYYNMSNPLCVIYHFIIIGSEIIKTGSGLFGKLKLVEIDRENEDKFCRLYIKQEYNDAFIEIPKYSPIISIEEDKTTDNKIEFNIKFVLAKSRHLVDIADNEFYKDSIIIVCNRDESMMSIFVNENGKLGKRRDFIRINNIERNNLNLYHILTTKKNDDSLKYGSIYPYTYVGDIGPDLVQDRVNITFKIMTRYDPEYVDMHTYDY